MKENYFIYNNIDSRNFGIRCGSFDNFTFPKLRIETITIEGRNGTLHETDNCYESYSRSIECYCDKQENIPQIAKWLQGSGELRLSNDLEKVFYVTINNNIDLESVAEYWYNFIIKFEVQPICESYTEHVVNDISKTFNIGGTIETSPIIEIVGKGDYMITINNKVIYLYDINGTFIIDTKMMIATENNNNSFNKIGGDDLSQIKLKLNSNNISVNNPYESFKVKYREANLC